MESRICRLLLGISLLCSSQTSRAELAQQVQQFFQMQHSTHQVTARISTPASQWLSCPNPQLSLPGNGRRWGNLSLSIHCGEQRRFIQVQVEVTGRYLVAARAVPSGKTLTAADLHSRQGRLDRLPPQVLLDSRQALGAVALRPLTAEQPLTAAMLRRNWVIKAGQEVQVFSQGNGFTVRGAGKAMNNAAVDEDLRVRMLSGQIIKGVAHADGTVRLDL